MASERTESPIVVALSRRTVAVLVVATILLILSILLLIPAVTVILVGGCLVALFLSYPLRLLEPFVPRRVAVGAVLFSALLLIIAGLLLVVPPLLGQLTALAQAVPGIANQLDASLRGVVERLISVGLLPNEADTVVTEVQQRVLARLSLVVEPLSSRLFGAVTSAIGTIVQTFGVVFVAVYLLLDAGRLRATVLARTPAAHRGGVEQFFEDFSTALSRYVDGLIVIALLQGLAAATFLTLLDVPFPLVLATWIALTSTVPYIGTWFGGVPAVALAALQSPLVGLATFGLFFASTTLIGNIITPRIQAQAVHVHPVIVLVTVVAAGEVLGLLGVLLAVPALAVAKVIIDYLTRNVRVRIE
jgi:predicted PurR-regulated permease PerM